MIAFRCCHSTGSRAAPTPKRRSSTTPLRSPLPSSLPIRVYAAEENDATTTAAGAGAGAGSGVDIVMPSPNAAAPKPRQWGVTASHTATASLAQVGGANTSVLKDVTDSTASTQQQQRSKPPARGKTKASAIASDSDDDGADGDKEHAAVEPRRTRSRTSQSPAAALKENATRQGGLLGLTTRSSAAARPQRRKA